MLYDSIFTLASGIAAIAWLILIIFPFRPFTPKLLMGTVVAGLCATYATLIYQNLQPGLLESFRTLDGVTALFTNKAAVCIGWIHYLAFDLVAGLYIAQNASKHGIAHGWVVPCLLLTFMFGPVGLGLYLLFRWALVKHYWVN